MARIVLGSRLAAAAAVFMVLSSCYGTERSAGTSSADAAGIPIEAQAASTSVPGNGTPSAADEVLARFDRDHPQCELWTNWSRMCSRTGAGGAAYCTADPGMPVPPSEPFCVSDSESQRSRPQPASLTPSQNDSMQRFCSPDAAARGPTGLLAEECGFVRGRPFNGYRLAARLHPWCEQWNEAVTNVPLCRTGGKRGLPDCAPEAVKGVESARGFYCARPALPSWCDDAAGFGIQAENAGRKIILPVGDRQEAYPVRGIYCRRRR